MQSLTGDYKMPWLSVNGSAMLASQQIQAIKNAGIVNGSNHIEEIKLVAYDSSLGITNFILFKHFYGGKYVVSKGRIGIAATSMLDVWMKIDEVFETALQKMVEEDYYIFWVKIQSATILSPRDLPSEGEILLSSVSRSGNASINTHVDVFRLEDVSIDEDIGRIYTAYIKAVRNNVSDLNNSIIQFCDNSGIVAIPVTAQLNFFSKKRGGNKLRQTGSFGRKLLMVSITIELKSSKARLLNPVLDWENKNIECLIFSSSHPPLESGDSCYVDLGRAAIVYQF